MKPNKLNKLLFLLIFFPAILNSNADIATVARKLAEIRSRVNQLRSALDKFGRSIADLGKEEIRFTRKVQTVTYGTQVFYPVEVTLDLSSKNINSLDGIKDIAQKISTEVEPINDLNIIQINLSNNKLQQLEDGVFDHLQNLKQLNLSFNPLTTLNADWFSNLSGLKVLLLENIDFPEEKEEQVKRVILALQAKGVTVNW